MQPFWCMTTPSRLHERLSYSGKDPKRLWHLHSSLVIGALLSWAMPYLPRVGVYFERDFPLGLINRLLLGSMYFSWAEVEKTNHDADSFTVG